MPTTSFDKLTVLRVIPLDAYAREEYGEAGWNESELGVAFDTGQPLSPHARFKDYHYDGLDVRDMPSADVARLKRQLRQGRGAKEAEGLAEEAAKRGDTIISLPGLKARKGMPFQVRPRGHRFQWTPEKPRGMSAFPEVKQVLMRQRAEVPSLETIRMAAIFAGLTVHAGTDEAEDTFTRVIGRFKAMHGAMPPVEMIQEVIGSHLPAARLRMYETALPWSTIVQDAMKRGVRDRELRKFLWTEVAPEDQVENIGLAKMSFALMLMGQNLCCLDTWILGTMFAKDPFDPEDPQKAAIRRRKVGDRVSKQWSWARAKSGREMGLRRYEQVEDALLKGNPFHDPSDPLFRSQTQWTAWEWALGVPAYHRPWLEITRELQIEPSRLAQYEVPF